MRVVERSEGRARQHGRDDREARVPAAEHHHARVEQGHVLARDVGQQDADGTARCSDDARVLHADLVVERAQHQLEHHAAHHDDGHGHGACARAQRTVRGERRDLLEEGGAHDEDAGHENEQVEAGRLDGLCHRGALVGLGGCGLVGRIVLLARAERKQAHDRGALAHERHRQHHRQHGGHDGQRRARRLPAELVDQLLADGAGNGRQDGQRRRRDADGQTCALLEPGVDQHRSRQVHVERRRHAVHHAIEVPLPQLGGVGARPRCQAEGRRNRCEDPARVVLLHQLAGYRRAHGGHQRLDGAVHGGVGLRPAELVHHRSHENARGIADNAGWDGIEPDAPDNDEPSPHGSFGTCSAHVLISLSQIP